MYSNVFPIINFYYSTIPGLVDEQEEARLLGRPPAVRAPGTQFSAVRRLSFSDPIFPKRFARFRFEIGSTEKYRVTQQVSHLGWVDSDFGFSTVCLILLGLMRNRQNGHSSWER